jgi:hypothetical protein
MNWIGNHAVAGRGDPLGEPIDKPLSQSTKAEDTTISQREGWIGARVELYKMRREFILLMLSKLKLFIRKV